MESSSNSKQESQRAPSSSTSDHGLEAGIRLALQAFAREKQLMEDKNKNREFQIQNQNNKQLEDREFDFIFNWKDDRGMSYSEFLKSLNDYIDPKQQSFLHVPKHQPELQEINKRRIESGDLIVGQVTLKLKSDSQKISTLINKYSKDENPSPFNLKVQSYLYYRVRESIKFTSDYMDVFHGKEEMSAHLMFVFNGSDPNQAIFSKDFFDVISGLVKKTKDKFTPFYGVQFIWCRNPEYMSFFGSALCDKLDIQQKEIQKQQLERQKEQIEREEQSREIQKLKEMLVVQKEEAKFKEELRVRMEQIQKRLDVLEMQMQKQQQQIDHAQQLLVEENRKFESMKQEAEQLKVEYMQLGSELAKKK